MLGIPDLRVRMGVPKNPLVSFHCNNCAFRWIPTIPQNFLTWEVNDEPTIFLFLFCDKRLGQLEVCRCAAVTEEEAGEALEHVYRTVSKTGLGRKDGQGLSVPGCKCVELAWWTESKCWATLTDKSS